MRACDSLFFVWAKLIVLAGAIMSMRRPRPSRRLAFGFGISTAIATLLGPTVEAQAQVQVDDNIQSRTAPYTISPFDKGDSGVSQLGYYDVCLGSGDLIVFLRKVSKNNLLLPNRLARKTDDELKKYFSARENRSEVADLLTGYFLQHRDIADKPWQRLNEYWGLTGQEKGFLEIQAKLKTLAPLAINFCTSATTVKVSFPFNPTYETNVLRSNQNNSPGESAGFGGTLQLVTPGLRPLDLIGLSLQSQSVRYSSQFSSKNFDAITATAAYQFFINAYGVNSSGEYPVYRGMDPKALPPTNMITVNTVAIGVQNQTVYVPLFHLEQVNLFTPQITLNHLNMPLFGGVQCAVRIPDPSKNGYCYYADISVTVGQTFADVPAQENANVAVSVTPGWRINSTDWNLTLPATATARDYQNVAGGRQDLLLQIGPTLTYAPPPFVDTAFISSVLFKLSATYNQNYSTVAKNSWHGIIVMPTLTVAFSP
jgi:hypothetical protein